jgi:hypothetical protein
VHLPALEQNANLRHYPDADTKAAKLGRAAPDLNWFALRKNSEDGLRPRWSAASETGGSKAWKLGRTSASLCALDATLG